MLVDAARGADPASTCGAPTGSSRSARRCSSGSSEKGAPPEPHARDPELGRHDRADARSRATTSGRGRTASTGRFVVMHSGNVGHAQDLDNLIRATTFLRDLDDLAVGDRRLRRPARRASSRSPSGSRPTRCASCRTSRASCCPSRSRPRTSTSSGSRQGLAGLRRAEPALRDPRRRAARDRRRRRRERDCAGRARRSAAGSSSRPAGPSCSRGRSASSHGGEHDLDGMGRRGRALRRGGGRPGGRVRPLPRAARRGEDLARRYARA